ncbi:MAG: ATP-dependent helicase [Bacteroidia bacterium]
MLNQIYKNKFSDVYKRLNKAQQKAVDTIEGPVMVIAGPGTGKTQILAARIANILEKTDINAENILCLTYTDAGAVAMRKRLNDFIGPASYSVNIHTFHSFCNGVIQDNLDYFGYNNLDAVSELEQIQFVREIIDELEQDNPLKRYTGETYYEVNRMLGLYALMKREHFTAEYIIEKVNEYLKSLPNREEYIYKRTGKRKDGTAYTKGDLNEDKIAEETRRMELLKAACITFNIYQNKLLQNKRYDFDDMLLWVIDAFKNNDSILANYQEQYQYILVDEFQDTSGSQNELLDLLLQYWDEPNVFVVGDDDQSIYRFQGANVENIEKFIKKYIGSINNKDKIITLNENYRSAQTILNTANAIIKNSNEGSRLISNKEIIAANPVVKNISQQPLVITFDNEASETVNIANQIIQLINEGVEPKEIAVLYREHKQSDELITYLLKKGIEINARKKQNILQQPVIKKILCILNFIQAELKQSHSGEAYLFELLHYNEFGINAIDIAKLAAEISNTTGKKPFWRDELKNFGRINQPNLFDTNFKAEKFYRVSKIMEGLIKDATQLTLQQLVFEVINRCGLLIYALKQKESEWNLSAINSFFNYIKSETLKNPSYELKHLLKHIDLLIDNKIGINTEQIFASNNGVNFITTHSSKGLEFEYVFIIGCTSKAWDKEKPNRGYKLPDNLITTNANLADEVRRLFYVALTRAKKYLQISFSEKSIEEKDLEPSVFISELNESNTTQNKKLSIGSEKIKEFYETLFTNNEAELPADILNNNLVDEILNKYTLSVTHLNNFLKCPIKFYFTNLIRVPAPKSASMTFGSAIHYALEKLFKNMIENNKQFDDIETIIQHFNWYMHRHKDSFTDEEFELKLTYGKKILPDYFNFYIDNWNKIVTIEKPFKNIVVEGVPLNGKLDKIEFNGNFVNVVDYKTGQYSKAKDKFKAPNPEKVKKAIAEEKEPKFEDEFGGDYWRQAIFYKLLLDYDKSKQWVMQSSEFDFVEPDKDTKKFHKEKIIINSKDVEIVKQQIKDVYTKIVNKQFANGCGKEDCEWCNFTKEFYSGKETIIPDANLEVE